MKEFLLCSVAALLLLACGLVIPAHLRAVDPGVLSEAGGKTAGLLNQGLSFLKQDNLGAAQLFIQAARDQGLPDRQGLGLAITGLTQQHPQWAAWGGGDPRLERFFASDPHLPKSGSEPFTTFVVREHNRTNLLNRLRSSPSPAVQQLLRCRSLTNTVLFSPSRSASGQVLDTAVAICGLLLDEKRLSPGLSNALSSLATASSLGADSQRLEQALLDLLSLGQRLNWGQLAVFVSQIPDAETLRLLTILVRQHQDQLPVMFSAVQLSANPAQVAAYLMNFGATGVNDLATSLRYGAGGVHELLHHNQRLHRPRFARENTGVNVSGAVRSLAAEICWRIPWLGLMIKWLFYLAAGFLLAVAVGLTAPAAPVNDRALPGRGFDRARQFLFALGFLLVVLLLSEPFLAQEHQRVEFPFRLRLPTVGGVVPVGTPGVNRTSMNNQLSLLPLLLFFVLQGLLYLACLSKLAEIRRQTVPARIKLKLLDNEDHLFDAGLYLGFVGTIVSLILVSLGVIQLSLMSAYSSTSFGIIFVSVFKIFNLRPLRRTLLLDAEAASPDPLAEAVANRLPSPS